MRDCGHRSNRKNPGWRLRAGSAEGAQGFWGEKTQKRGWGQVLGWGINPRMSWLKDAGCCSLSGHLSRQISAVFSHFTKHHFTQFLQFQCPWKGNHIVAAERKISKTSRSGRLDPEHPSAGIKQQEFTSQPGRCLGRKP